MLFCCVSLSAQPADHLNQINQAFELYDEGRLTEAEHIALRMLTRSDTLNSFDKFNLHKLLAFIAIANDDEEGGRRQFIAALRFNPAMSPDPISWSPKVRRVFDKAREEHIKEESLQQKRVLVLEATVGREASMRSLILPGSGQIYKGDSKRGIVLGASFWGSVALFTYSAINLSQSKNDYLNANTSHDANRLWKDYRNTQYMFNVSGILVGGIYLYTYFDALWGEPKTVLEIEVNNK